MSKQGREQGGNDLNQDNETVGQFWDDYGVRYDIEKGAIALKKATEIREVTDTTLAPDEETSPFAGSWD